MAADRVGTVTAIDSDEAIESVDLPLKELMPLQKRSVRKASMARLEANIRAVGLIEPLLAYRHDDGQHYILDGYLRYQVLLAIGRTSAPCIVLRTLDLYTPNRQVNFLSRSQRWRMLERALPVVGEDVLKSALGLREIRRGFTPTQRQALCREVLTREEEGRIAKIACLHLVHVTHERQREILALCDQAGDSTAPFVRAQVLRTAPAHRLATSGRRSPWNKAAETRKMLVDKLVEAERRQDFYQGLYRQYATDLIRLATYVRQIVSIRPLRDALAKMRPDILKDFKRILEQCGDEIDPL